MRQRTSLGAFLMSNYEVRRHGKKWKVYEVSTNQYIFAANNKVRAVEIQKSLQNGSGFNGQTPTFFRVS